MDTGGKRKMKADYPLDLIGRLRKPVKAKAELCCPVCCVTLWPGTVELHYQQERAKLASTITSLAHSKKRTSQQGATLEGKTEYRGKTVVQATQQLLESVKRRHILFHQNATPLYSDAGPSSCTSTCPVCDTPLPANQEMARSHVNECLGVEEEGQSSESESYEEYTWCNVTRVRATSMLTPEARANMFDGTIVSQGDNVEAIVDVEEDETKTYGPVQYSEKDTRLCGRGIEEEESGMVLEGDSACGEKLTGVKANYAQHCLICMDSYHRPLVSIQCWHVFCEDCWLQVLAAKKVCPKCKQITSHADLRKIFI